MSVMVQRARTRIVGRVPQSARGGERTSVGSAQDYATALPKPSGAGFEADEAGQHSHYINFEVSASRDVAEEQFNSVARPNIGNSMPRTEDSGRHRHPIRGGNKETRPINAYVNWIIRVQ